jgi:short-subunit dehydrogenase
MTQDLLQDKTALVTGASSGLGAEFARQLAARGCHLVLTARREEPLAALKRELVESGRIQVDCVPLDLETPDAPRQIFDRLAAAGKTVDILVNNAGFGVYGHFLDTRWERERALLEVDILALVQLTKLFVAGMVSRKSGYILNVASTAAFQPVPGYAAYAAAKSFVLSFSEALCHELRETGVSCTALCPGMTRTGFFDAAGQASLASYQRMTMMNSADVCRIGLKAMVRRRPVVVAGWLNALMAWSARVGPRQLTTAIAEWTVTPA